jgi:hypothetical protein
MHALRDPALKATARMPLLDQYHPGRPFEIMESDVCRWLIVQPLIITVIGKAFFDCSHLSLGLEPPPLRKRLKIEY